MRARVNRTFMLALTVITLAVISEWFLAALYGKDEVSCSVASFPVTLPDVPEASGIAQSNRSSSLFWTMNDTGEPTLFGVTTDGQIRARVRVPGAQVSNWEDLSVGPCATTSSCVYIADIGDNRQTRPSIRIYRVPEPAAHERVTAAPQVFEGKYPDGPHDAEAAFILPDKRLYVITKDKYSRVYRFPLESGKVTTLELVAMLPLNNVTDADASSDGTRVAVRTHQDVVFYRTSELLKGDVEHGSAVPTGEVGEPQGEGVAFGRTGAIVLAGEGGGSSRKPRPGTLASLQCRFNGA
jgi:hypothetical protein